MYYILVLCTMSWSLLSVILSACVLFYVHHNKRSMMVTCRVAKMEHVKVTTTTLCRINSCLYNKMCLCNTNMAG